MANWQHAAQESQIGERDKGRGLIESHFRVEGESQAIDFMERHPHQG